MSDSERPFIPVVEEVKWEWTTESRISTVIGLLPTSLQTRMSPFRHFRRSASLGNLRTPEDLTSAPSSSLRRPSSMGGGGAQATDGDVVRARHRIDSPQSEISQTAVVPRARTTREMEPMSASGINWRFARQGANLLGIAADASADENNEAFERKAYVDGLTYVLRSLPPDLDAYESEQIRNALPVGLASQHLSSTRSGAATPNSATGLPKSFVHRLVQIVVLNLFLLIHFILPYIVVIVKSVASVERRYKVSETIIGHGVNCFNAAGRHCARAAEVVLTANDGKVGQNVSGSFAWTVEEVTRGISDGVGEGLVMTKLRDSARASPAPS